MHLKYVLYFSVEWHGFKFVGDNIDKNIRPTFQRHHIQGQSLHYFHGLAVQDRVCLHEMSDAIPSPSVVPTPSQLLPSKSDFAKLKEELKILVSRLATANFPNVYLLHDQYCVFQNSFGAPKPIQGAT